MARVAFEQVTKVFGDGTRAVDGLNLDIADGEFLVLVGPSGCGKTTALRMIAGLEDISEGTLRIGSGLRLRKLAKADIDRRVRQPAAILGLSEFLRRKPRQLSGGQRQRVAMG